MSDAAEKEKSLTVPSAPLSNTPSESGEDQETKRKKKLELNRVASRVSILHVLGVWFVATNFFPRFLLDHALGAETLIKAYL